MTERLEIKIEGTLPEKGKHAVLAAAEAMAEQFVKDFAENHAGIELAVSVKAIRPGKKAAPVADELKAEAAVQEARSGVNATPGNEATEPPILPNAHRPRHAAE